jgi:basic membrane protein A
MVEFAPFSKAIPADVIAKVNADVKAMSAGTLHPFKGPLKRQDGTVWMADGQIPSDEELKKVNFYVEGIQGSLPT